MKELQVKEKDDSRERKRRKYRADVRGKKRGREVRKNHEHLTGTSKRGAGESQPISPISPSDQNSSRLSGTFNLHRKILASFGKS